MSKFLVNGKKKPHINLNKNGHWGIFFVLGEKKDNNANIQ